MRPKSIPSDEQSYFEGLLSVKREEYKPGPIATRFHRSPARTRLNVGALGSGKTRMMCEHLNNLCLKYPGARVVIARKDLGDLKKTTQIEYLEKVISPETVDRFNINDSTLYYKNGSQAFFMECKTPSNFKSLEIVGWGIDEADENEEGVGKENLITTLNGRLRQKIKINGKDVPIPYCGILTYNPTDDDHWLAKLEDNPTSDMEVFRSTTYDNASNLPPDYIPSLLSSLAPWEVSSLIWGQRALRPKGKPVIHGFTVENNVRSLRVVPYLPIYRGWDFGFGNPTCVIAQYDPEYKRVHVLREVCGKNEQLKFFAPRVVQVTKGLVGPVANLKDVCDPHGADQRDVGESSVEYLRIHHGIHANYQRQTIKKGLDEIQELVLSKKDFKSANWTPLDTGKLPQEASLLVDASCKTLISSLLGGYYRDEDGNPFKDNVHDHVVDCLRYFVVHTMNQGLAFSLKNKRRFIPRCSVTGY